VTRTIGVVTVGRSDFGIWRPVLRAIRADSALRLHLIVAGAHLDGRFGNTVGEIESEGFTIADRVSAVPGHDTCEAVAEAMGESVAEFARVYQRRDLSLLLLLGDRFEMYAAASAAVPFSIPIAHLHGGEVTEGAMDDAFRHAITKLSHLHFVSTEEYRRRVIQMGEEPWRVTVSGAPSLDNLRELELPTRGELERDLGVALQPAPLLVTYHPVTRETSDSRARIQCVLDALDAFPGPIVLTYPNTDMGCTAIMEAVRDFAASRTNALLFANLGTRRYFALMSMAAAMAGNSSSGIIEAASFDLPVVNVGPRQQGRTHGPNVLDVDCDAAAIRSALSRAASPEFRASLAGMRNPYGDGHAASRIVERLKSAQLGKDLIMKRFHDIPVEPPS